MKYLLVALSLCLLPAFLSAHPSWGIVVDEAGNVYFADILHYERGAVWKVSANGTLTLLLKDFHAHNVSLDEDGSLITAHGEGEHVMVRLRGNQRDTLIAKNDFKIFYGGNATYSPVHGILFGIDHYIWKLNAQQVKEKVSDYKFEWNQAVYCDDKGYIYAPDIGKAHGQLVRISPDGSAKILASDLIAHLDRPVDPHNDVLLGMAKGPGNSVYIAELAGQRIIRIDENGAKSDFYKSAGEWFPTAITFHSGNAYLLEYKMNGPDEGPQVIRIDKSGDKHILFNYQDYIASDKEITDESEGNILVLLIIGLLTAGAVISLRKLQYI